MLKFSKLKKNPNFFEFSNPPKIFINNFNILKNYILLKTHTTVHP